jgi:hypothetical protein
MQASVCCDYNRTPVKFQYPDIYRIVEDSPTSGENFSEKIHRPNHHYFDRKTNHHILELATFVQRFVYISTSKSQAYSFFSAQLWVRGLPHEALFPGRHEKCPR